jgi:ankyrin repeat protein
LPQGAQGATGPRKERCSPGIDTSTDHLLSRPSSGPGYFVKGGFVFREPDLDFYRRRAKELLKLAGSGNDAALARFTAHHPDFRKPDSKRAGSTFALNQAQLVVAREMGFGSWPRFKAYLLALERTRDQSPEDRLQHILRTRDLAALRAFLDSHPGAAGFRIEPLGYTPLHLATEWKAGAELLLAAGADINAVSHQLGLTPLRAAIRFGDESGEMALFFLEQGADPDVASVPQKTTMQVAAYARSPNVIHALIQRGVPPDIFGAVTLEDEELVRQLASRAPALLAERMRPHQNVTITPLHLAAFHDLPQMVDVLIDLGAKRDDKDEQGRTPIDLALHGGRRKAYESLHAHGSTPQPELLAMVGNAERSERIARLHFALTNGHVAAVAGELDADPSLLNQHLPDVWGTGGTFGATPLHWAAMSGHIPVARLLLERGADLTLTDLTYGAIPRGWAKEYRRREMVAFLEAHAK